MSQITWTDTDAGAFVQTGWDRMTQRFHLTVKSIEPPVADDDDDTLYDCWLERAEQTPEWVYIKLTELGVGAPVQLLPTLLQHQAADVGNLTIEL